MAPPSTHHALLADRYKVNLKAPLERVSIKEGRARVHAPPPQSEPHLLALPKGFGGELWQRFYNDALLRGHPDPDRMATSAVRSREKTMAIEAARHTLIVCTKVPPLETVGPRVASAKKGRTVVHAAFRCTAMTLAGTQCTFKKTCGTFCNKHAC